MPAPLRFPAETTPALAGFFPDPTACRVDGTTYVANSSFEYFPGAPVHASVDLEEWRPVGNILTRRSQFVLGSGAPSTGIYGSTLRYHDGRFWFITTNVHDARPVQTIVTASTADGPWSDPITVSDAVGIDPDLTWDEQGRCLLTWCSIDFDTFTGSIRQVEIDPADGSTRGDPVALWSGTGLAFPEGPHLYRRDPWWYLLIAEGGTERGHAVSVARGPTASGPFESCPANPIFSRRSIAHPVQSTGHADLVELDDGHWAVVYLGMRPRGAAPGFSALGRETFVADVVWEDDWPVFRPATRSVAAPPADFRDEFAAGELHDRWIVPGGEPASIAEPDPRSGLRLAAGGNGPASGLLCFRPRHTRWAVTARVDLQKGGARLVLRQDDRHWIAVEASDATVEGVVHIGDVEQRYPVARLAGTEITLRIRVTAPPGSNTGPDEVRLEATGPSLDSAESIAVLDGRYFSPEVAGGFTGRVVGIGALGSVARVLAVEYAGTEP